jgi:hypothetical protein
MICLGTPKRVLMVLVDEARHNGDYALHPFRFQHHDMAELLLTVDGKHYPYAGGYKVDFAAHDYHEGYTQLLADCGNEVDIDVSEYDNDFTIWSFNLTESGPIDDGSVAPRRSGEVFLSFQLRNNPAANLICLCILERDRVLTFDKNRNFTDNFA